MKRIVFTLFVLLISSNFIFAQLSLFGSSPIKLIEKGEFADAEIKINKDLLKTPDDISTNYAMSLLLSKRRYTSYNAEKSYEYLSKSIKIFENTKDDKEFKKLNKIPINQVVFQSCIDTICRLAMEDVLAKNNVESLDRYLDFYLKTPDNYKKKVIEVRDVAAYKVACDKNTLASYQHFISKYPDATQNAEAIQKRNESAFQKAKANDNIDSYKDFVVRYPDAKEVNLAWERIHEIAFALAEKENTSFSYKRFYDDYPLSKQNSQAFSSYEKRQYVENITVGDFYNYRTFIEKHPNNSFKTVAQDSIYAIGQKTENLDILKYCLDNFTGEKRKSTLILYHDIFTIDGEKLTLDLFYDKFKDDFLNSFKVKDYELLTLSNELLLHMPYNITNFSKYDQYIRTSAPREKALNALQKMISPDLEIKDFQAALIKIKTYMVYFGKKNKKLLDLVSILDSK